MKIQLRFLGLLWAGLGFLPFAHGQTPMDGLMMSKGDVCVALVYEKASWDRYWEGSTIRINQNIGTFTREMGMPMLIGGISDNVNVIVSLPYVKTAASAGQLAGAQGIQDFGLSLKARVVEKAIGESKLTAFSNLSFSTPVSNYLSDYQPFSLGFGAKEIGLRAIGQYEWTKGPYVRASVAYLHRGRTEAERDFYFTNQAFYTSTMDVPDAVQSQVTVGSWFFNYKLRIETSLMAFRCPDGDDIRVYSMPQPTNKVNFDRVDGFAQYYFTPGRGFGLIANYHRLLSGRNMGQSTGFSMGLTYQFKSFN